MNLRLPLLFAALLVSQLPLRAALALPTIDRMVIHTSSATIPHTYNPGGSFILLVEEASEVYLSTGVIGDFGAGGSGGSSTTYSSATVS